MEITVDGISPIGRKISQRSRGSVSGLREGVNGRCRVSTIAIAIAQTIEGEARFPLRNITGLAQTRRRRRRLCAAGIIIGQV